jgi:hypothetical protein
MPFSTSPGGTEIRRPSVLTWHDDSRQRHGKRFPIGSRAEFKFSDLDAATFRASDAFSFAAFISVP